MRKSLRYKNLAVLVGAGSLMMAAAPLYAQPTQDESNQELNREVQELKEQVRQLKAQMGAQQSAAQQPSADSQKNAQAQAAGSKVVTVKDNTLSLGDLKVTLGGFMAAESVYRTRNQTADIASDFKGYPFSNNPNYYTSEFRESARQSRLQLLVQGPTDGLNKVEGFFAGDFLSSGTTSNQNQSNSYTFRMREFYGDWVRTDWNAYALAGQTWSMATLYKQGLTPRAENIPLTIDASYVPGFTYARLSQLRLVKNFGDFAAVGLSLEEPENLIKGSASCVAGGVSTGNCATNPGNGGGLLNATATYSTDVAPDVIVKAAVDPGFGHYELFSMTRFFRDRTKNTAFDNASNKTTVAQSFGGGMIIPIMPKLLEFQASGVIGEGNGRYGASTLGDSTVDRTDNSVVALKEQQLLLGLIGHPNPRLDLYLYGGREHLESGENWGNGHASDNSGCEMNYNNIPVAGTPAVPTMGCSGAISTVGQLTGGFWWKFYKGSLGYLTTGMQGSYTKLDTYKDANGVQGHTNDTTVMLSFRYYPFAP